MNKLHFDFTTERPRNFNQLVKTNPTEALENLIKRTDDYIRSATLGANQAHKEGNAQLVWWFSAHKREFERSRTILANELERQNAKNMDRRENRAP